MADKIVTKKTLILHFQDNPEEKRVFTYKKGDGDIYINSVILSRKSEDASTNSESDQIIDDDQKGKVIYER